MSFIRTVIGKMTEHYLLTGIIVLAIIAWRLYSTRTTPGQGAQQEGGQLQ